MAFGDIKHGLLSIVGQRDREEEAEEKEEGERECQLHGGKRTMG